MNFFQNISIKSRFNFILVSFIVLIFIVIGFFLFSVKKINQYNTFYNKTDRLKINYLNLRRYESLFLLRYNDDIDFFISEQNTYIDKFEKTSDIFSASIQNLITDPITKKSNLKNNFVNLENTHENYQETFFNLSHKIFLRGNINSGIIGDLRAEKEKLSKMNLSPGTRSLVSEMIFYTDDYFISKDEKNYAEFLKRYNKLAQKNIPIQSDSLASETPKNLSDFQSTLKSYKTDFSSLVKINKIIGLKYDEGLQGKLRRNAKEAEPQIEDILSKISDLKIDSQRNAIIALIIFFILIGLIFIILFIRFSNSIAKPLNDLKNYIQPLSLGIFPSEKIKIEGNNELSEICDYTNKLISGLEKTSRFAAEIGKGNFSLDYKPLSEKDALGNALIEMKENIVKSSEEEEKRKEEDRIRTWTNEGLTKFNDILRQTQGNINEMSSKVISELVKFINANQGGMFVFNDDEENKYLELKASYAYGHEKKKKKIIYPGEGMVGMVADEKKTTYMTEIPESYITITSGLGEAVPRSLLIVPMITEDEVIGVIELASFNHLKDYEIKFVEILSETIASSLSITKINQKTAALLEQSQKQAELMKIQEEEMRQNYEELQQLQEDSVQKAAQMSGILAAIDTSSFVLEIDLNGKITSVNQNLSTLLKKDDTEIINTGIKDFIQTKNDQEFNEFWQKLLNGQNIQRTEHIISDNEEFWLSTVYAPIIDETGKILYILFVASDLTESKKLEFELKEREKDLRQNLEEIEKAHKEAERKQHILENTNEMLKANEKTLQSAVENAMKQRKELAKKIAEIAEKDAEASSWLEGINHTNILIEFDLKGNILSVNPIFEKTFNYKNDELKGKNHEFLIPESVKNSEEYKKRWEKLQVGIHVSGTFLFSGKNNKRIYLQGTYTAIKNKKGKPIKIYLLGFDTSEVIKRSEELKARETELFFQIENMELLQKQSSKQEEELMKKAIQLAENEAIAKSQMKGINQTNLIAEFDTEGIIISVNELFKNIFLYDDKDIISKNHKILLSEKFINSQQYKTAWEKILKGEYVTGTFPFIAKDKSKRFVHATFTPIKNSKEEVIKILLTGYDNTELVKRSEELKARETELFFKLEELKTMNKNKE